MTLFQVHVTSGPGREHTRVIQIRVHCGDQWLGGRDSCRRMFLSNGHPALIGYPDSGRVRAASRYFNVRPLLATTLDDHILIDGHVVRIPRRQERRMSYGQPGCACDDGS